MIGYLTDRASERERGLVAAAAALRRGRLVGLPVDAAYGIAADAFNVRGVRALAEAKGRSDLTIPDVVGDVAAAT